VNVASRMESSGMPGMVHLSEQTEQELRGHFLLEERGFVECKGLGQVKTFFLKGHAVGNVGALGGGSSTSSIAS